MITIKCPECNTDTKLFLVNSSYEGPHKCWKCKGLFTLRIESNMVKSCEPMSPEELERHRQWEELRNKSKQP